jgi:hypothetical protein
MDDVAEAEVKRDLLPHDYARRLVIAAGGLPWSCTPE